MKRLETRLPGTRLYELTRHGDERGYFMENWNRERYRDAGLDVGFVQSNLSRSAKGVLRGLHFQQPRPQGKLVWVIEGEVFDVAVDIRPDSPTFGQWEAYRLSADNRLQFYVPPGFAHGFCVTSEHALFCYLCTEVYVAEADRAIAWNDPDLAIDWPCETPELSARDRSAPVLRDIPAEQLPRLA